MCPYIANDAITQEGFEAWEVITRCSGQLNYYPNGTIAGFNIPSVLSVSQVLGYDAQAQLLLLNYADQGLSEALKDHGNSNTEHFHPGSGC